MSSEVKVHIFFGSLFTILGLIAFLDPNRMYNWIVIMVLLSSLFNAVLSFYNFVKTRSKHHFVYLFISFLIFSLVYYFNTLPGHVIRIFFGLYCFLSAFATGTQFVINTMNKVSGRFFYFFITIIYLFLGISCAINQTMPIDFLLSLFGVYTLLLGLRYLNDANDMVDKSVKNSWKRKIHIAPPTLICAMIPDWLTRSFNDFLSRDEEYVYDDHKEEYNSCFKVIVQLGKQGFNTLGHICISYNGMVYSYGNYDMDTAHIIRAIGSGTLFLAPYDRYIDVMQNIESNTLFVYDIKVDEMQELKIKNKLEYILDHSIHWECLVQKDEKGNYDHDYASRLYKNVGATFYKVHLGKFKTYFALGGNCSLFVDEILGELGADVLNMRGIISPGTYLEYLQNEYLKKGSPVVSRKIYTVSE